jgi:proline dehydrogenase
MLLDAAAKNPNLYPAFATHDDQIIDVIKKYSDELKIPKSSYEFQMLYGIRGELQAKLHSEGYNFRVYVPYGTEWYGYFMRRLAERPANLWFFVSNFFKR